MLTVQHPLPPGSGPARRFSRRTLLTAGGAGLLGLHTHRLSAAESDPSATMTHRGRAKSVIFLFLFGGPSQFETFDLKPHGVSDIRGPFRPIRSRTPDLQICEHLPRLADCSDKYCVLRAMSHSYNDHSSAAHYIQTGRPWQVPIGGGFVATPNDWPSFGSVADYLAQTSQHSARDLANYMVVPNHLGRLQESGQYRRPGEYAGWLGQAYHPLTTRVDRRDSNDNPYWRDCSDSELSFAIAGLDPPTPDELARISARSELLETFDALRHVLDRRRTDELDQIRHRALDLITSPRTRRALDVRLESDRLRDRYGRHLFGQSALLARRLVEAGTRFVTVHYDACDGYSWDSHVHSRDVQNHLLPTLDQTLSALLEDLDERGMLDETLVVVLGEMGRTPQPTPEWGRGHWSTVFPAVLAGAGVRGGITWGASDRHGAYPVENATSPEDLAATIYHALGIDPTAMIHLPDGRPTPLVQGGRPLQQIFG